MTPLLVNCDVLMVKPPAAFRLPDTCILVVVLLIVVVLVLSVNCKVPAILAAVLALTLNGLLPAFVEKAPWLVIVTPVGILRAVKPLLRL